MKLSKVFRATNSLVEFLGSFLGSQEKAKDATFTSYKKYINGFATILEKEEASSITNHRDVLSVFPNGLKKLLTTSSWGFMGLEKNGTTHLRSLWKHANLGENTITANIDTGVWPKSKSFCDHGYGPIPSKWKELCVNETKIGVRGDRKIVGASYFNQGYLASGNTIPTHLNTPRDHEGHGTHTLSTADGNFVQESIYGGAKGISKGGLPRARVAAYKVCFSDGCYDSDILHGFEFAIHDGVDVISLSVGGSPVDYSIDSIAIGSFHAVMHNIFASTPGGNSGPFPGTVTNIAPWLITVGASTLDRKFKSTLVLENGLKIEGESLANATGENYFFLLDAKNAKNANSSEIDANLCKRGSLDPMRVKGKILVCLRGDTARVEKGLAAAEAGAVGFILCNTEDDGYSLNAADLHFLPAVNVSYEDSLSLYKYLNSTSYPSGYITTGVSVSGMKPSPNMASFSSRGPNVIASDILKPDITAPGVSILASFAEDVRPTMLHFHKRRTPFNIESGTSMSCPHVAGVVGLLKSAHPDWSPAAIRSAIMTTARTRENTGYPVTDETYSKTNTFGYGAGHIQPHCAQDPGLVYDLTIEDHLKFLCASGYNQTMIRALYGKSNECGKELNILNYNYPSITVGNRVSGKVTMTRTLKNVGTPGTYSAGVHHPHGISVSVEP